MVGNKCFYFINPNKICVVISNLFFCAYFLINFYRYRLFIGLLSICFCELNNVSMAMLCILKNVVKV